MLEIVPFQPGDMDVLIRFVSAIQEHERLYVPELKSGDEIGEGYAHRLLKKVAGQNGLILMAHKAESIIGFICGWIDRDDDPLLQEKYSDHAYVSDIFVSETHRGQGVAQELLKTLEMEMAKRGCKRIRVCSKASNAHAIGLYKNSDYQPYEIIFSKTIGASISVSLPVFTTERLILREVTEADAPAYEKNFVDYEVISQLTAAVPWPYPEGGVLDYLRSQIFPHQGKDRWVWAIFLKENPAEAIGCVDLWREAKPDNRGFWLGRKYWGRGIMTEAVEPVMDYAFNILGFESVILANALGNSRSRRVKEKNGARLLRTEPAKFVNPAYTEHEIWELTKEQWEMRHKNGNIQ